MKAKKKRKTIPWKLAGLSFVGLIIAAVGFVQHDKVEKVLSTLEIDFLSSARAEGSERTPGAVKPAANAPAAATEMVETKEELDHLSKLRDKKKELDAREEEINRMEAELQQQKTDLEVRLKDLRETREEISKMLEDRVKNDEQKVETLVQMYSNMRPPQAAKVFETLDEDLAIDILGRMKKKSAADIMNLLKPEKAQIFSEKFAGYKRK
jgi:flagellar motility protein MotE (MotC chaperone)